MSIGEAVRLTRVLQQDPSSMLAAAVNEWQSPRTREWFVLADLFDLTHTIHSKKKPKPYPRPYRDGNSRRRGRTTRSRAEVLAILADHGHNFTEVSHG